MGYLTDTGNTLSYPDSKPYIEGIKKDGVLQFLNLYKKFKDLEAVSRLWGDELEYHIINIDPVTKKVRVKLVAEEIMQRIKDDAFEPQYEYGKWMIEAVPRNPYDVLCDPEPVLRNITTRRTIIQKSLDPNDYILSNSVFPLLGVGDYYLDGSKREADAKSLVKETEKTESVSRADEEEKREVSLDLESPAKKDSNLTASQKRELNEVSNSMFIDDEIINAHPRFPTLTRNLRLRRGEPMCIKIPIFKDVNTSFKETEDEPFPGFIYMDAMAFGMGCGCLQQTFAAKNVSIARYLTDQLAVIAPLMVINSLVAVH